MFILRSYNKIFIHRQDVRLTLGQTILALSKLASLHHCTNGVTAKSKVLM